MTKNPKMVMCRNCNAAITANVKRCPSCGAKNKKPFYQKWWFILIVIVVAISAVNSIKGNISEKENKKTEYRWPDSELASMIPKPDSKYGKIHLESESSFSIEVYDISNNQYEDYIEECKNKGFTVDYSKHESYYSAENEDGYSLNLTYDDKDKKLDISLYSPTIENKDEPEEDTDKDTPSTENNQEDTDQPETTENTKQEENSNSELVDGMRPEFKTAMDSYEAFYDEYCTFMEQYSGHSTDLTWLAKYSDLMAKAADMDEKFASWDDDGMNDAETKYYIEVNARVLQRLADMNIE